MFEQNDIEIAKKIIQRFEKEKSIEETFYNLCFCVLVPQVRFSTILKTIQILKSNNFYEKTYTKNEILEFIKSVRFKNRKSEYLLELKHKSNMFWETLMILLESEIDPQAKRKWLIGNIKGMGMKSASHFLRNHGEVELAIIDTHILKHFQIKDKKFNYLDLENRMKTEANETGVNIAVLDALIWKQFSNTNWENFVY